MNVRLVEAELFLADRDERTKIRTDMTKLIVAFRNLENVPKTQAHWPRD
jgi:hypothetical protein